MAGEETIPEGFVEAWADTVEAHVDLERLEDDVAQPVALEATGEARPTPVATDSNAPRIAVARDGAFCFYYRDNLDLLEACGAELVEFAPTTDPVPDGVDGIYIGGGYPEEEAATLAQNTEMLDEIRRASEAGLPIYAECGGLMLLGSWLEDADGERHEMAGIFPWGVTMGERPKMDYVEVTAGEGHPLFPAGTAARGHLFHYGEMVEEPPASVDRTYRLEPVREAPLEEGWCVERTLASWVHLHFGSNPGWAEGFVAAC
jgi:cobyrinic acid a,c-diamide synthase